MVTSTFSHDADGAAQPHPSPTWMRQLPPRHHPRVLHVNATANFGGVAELLNRLVDAQTAHGVEAGWLVISGSAEFFELAKQLHYLLHGKGTLGTLKQPEVGEMYRATLAPQAEWLAAQIGPDDVVVLHDAQTLGMAPRLAATGARIAWHLHIGTDDVHDEAVNEVWEFFAPELPCVDVVLTTKPEFAPPAGYRFGRHVVAPAIDPDAPKNRELEPAAVRRLLDGIGLTAPDRQHPDALVDQDGPLPSDATTVLQVSRWDPLKDMAGVLRCFARLDGDAHLILAGPNPYEIDDDPEGLAVLEGVRAARAALPADRRARVHIVLLSLRDGQRNALLVNALQRRADVVLQKSLEEGFGLTLTEAMVKRKAVIASDVGGLRSQVDHGWNGLLVGPTDDDAAVAALSRLIGDPELRARMGARAAATVTDRFLMSRLVADYERFVYPALVS